MFWFEKKKMGIITAAEQFCGLMSVADPGGGAKGAMAPPLHPG